MTLCFLNVFLGSWNMNKNWKISWPHPLVNLWQPEIPVVAERAFQFVMMIWFYVCIMICFSVHDDIYLCAAIEGFVLYAGGDYALHLNIMLFVQVMAYMMSGTFAHRYSGALDMRTRISECAETNRISGGEKRDGSDGRVSLPDHQWQ